MSNELNHITIEEIRSLDGEQLKDKLRNETYYLKDVPDGYKLIEEGLTLESLIQLIGKYNERDAVFMTIDDTGRETYTVIAKKKRVEWPVGKKPKLLKSEQSSKKKPPEDTEPLPGIDLKRFFIILVLIFLVITVLLFHAEIGSLFRTAADAVSGLFSREIKIDYDEPMASMQGYAAYYVNEENRGRAITINQFDREISRIAKSMFRDNDFKPYPVYLTFRDTPAAYEFNGREFNPQAFFFEDDLPEHRFFVIIKEAR
jgi:hypothetical protein